MEERTVPRPRPYGDFVGGVCQLSVRQGKDIYADIVVLLSAGSKRARRDGNMPALRQISFADARKIAIEKGLHPSKVKGRDTLRFSKRPSDKLQVITWDEFEQKATSRDLAVYESAGWMKLMKKH
jgi:hypothetical protein